MVACCPSSFTGIFFRRYISAEIGFAHVYIVASDAVVAVFSAFLFEIFASDSVRCVIVTYRDDFHNLARIFCLLFFFGGLNKTVYLTLFVLDLRLWIQKNADHFRYTCPFLHYTGFDTYMIFNVDADVILPLNFKYFPSATHMLVPMHC